MTSATYRQSSAAPPALVERDPDNVLLARGPRFRLEAEMVRDTVLAASGLLSRKIGGPSVFPPQPDGIWDIPYSSEKWTPSDGEDRYRRGLYVFIRRSAAYPSFMTFDATSREHCIVRRVRTNTPLQALTTLNDEAFFEAARALAARVLRETPPAPRRAQPGCRREPRLVRLPPRRDPHAEAGRGRPNRRLVQRGSSNGSGRIPRRPRARSRATRSPASTAAEQAAWTLVANALLNLDEALTKE